MASVNQLKQDFLSTLMKQQSNGHSHSSIESSVNINDPNDMLRQTILHGKKGYDLRLFLDSLVATKFLCCLCKNVCRDAQELSCSNAHIFCKQCIEQHFQVAQISNKPIQCPICHETQDSGDRSRRITFRASRFVNGHIKELQVKCIQSHNNISCNWNGRLSELVQHMSRDCMFNIIQCPFSLLGCPQSRLYKYQLQKHISNVQDCNKHISLALQKIKNLKIENSEKSELNNNLMGQLRAIKAISKNKETKINVLTKDLDSIKDNHKQLLVEYTKASQDLEQANHRLSQYEKAVTLLKTTNENLVKEIEILKMQQNHQSVSHYPSSMSELSNYRNNNNNINNDLSRLLSNNNNNNNMNNMNSMNNNTSFSQLIRSQSNSSQTSISNASMNNNNNSNNLEFLVSRMNLEDKTEKKIESESDNSNSNSISSKRVLYEFVKMHDDLPKEFNTMAQNALLQPNDDEASRFVRVLLESQKHPQFKQDIATIVSKLQNNKR